MALGGGVDVDGTSDLAGEQARHKVGTELRRVRTSQGMSLSELGRQVHYSKWFAFDFLVEIGVSIRQHRPGSLTGSGGSDHVRYRPWDRPRGQARAAPDVLSAGVTEHDRRADLPRERHTAGVLVAVHARHRYVPGHVTAPPRGCRRRPGCWMHVDSG